MIFLPATVLLSTMPSAGNAVQFSYSVLAATGRTTTVWARLNVFVGHFYPHSSHSLSDLDQAVATTAGATVLGLGIYSVANALYEMQSSEQATRVEEEDRIELDRLGQHQMALGLENSNGPPAEDERNEVPE